MRAPKFRLYEISKSKLCKSLYMNTLVHGFNKKKQFIKVPSEPASLEYATVQNVGTPLIILVITLYIR